MHGVESINCLFRNIESKHEQGATERGQFSNQGPLTIEDSFELYFIIKNMLSIATPQISNCQNVAYTYTYTHHQDIIHKMLTNLNS